MLALLFVLLNLGWTAIVVGGNLHPNGLDLVIAEAVFLGFLTVVWLASHPRQIYLIKR